MTRPVPDINEPLPPELKRTLDFCRCSSHALVGLKLYFSFSCLVGGALNSHIPSSARANIAKPTMHRIVSKLSFRGIIGHHRASWKARQPRPRLAFSWRSCQLPQRPFRL